MNDAETLLNVMKLPQEEEIKFIAKLLRVPKLDAVILLAQNSPKLCVALFPEAQRRFAERVEFFTAESLALATDEGALRDIGARLTAPDTETFPALRRLLTYNPAFFIFRGFGVYTVGAGVISFALTQKRFEAPVSVPARAMKRIISKELDFAPGGGGLRLTETGDVFGGPPVATSGYGELSLRPWDFHGMAPGGYTFVDLSQDAD